LTCTTTCHLRGNAPTKTGRVLHESPRQAAGQATPFCASQLPARVACATEPARCVQAAFLYGTIAGFYHSPVDPAVRSMMNVPFTIPSNADLEATFVKDAAAAGFVRLAS
jgi:hypothetical protein